MKTAGLIIIGDEILTGKVKDENSLVFAQHMFNQGVSLRQIIVIPDEITIIAETVKSFSKLYSYVASSGGIGPTHDDLTLEAIAQSLGRSLEEHLEAVDYFRKAQEEAGRGSFISPVQLKMLSYPKGAEVYFAKPMWLPLIRVDNLFIFPGVPSLFARLLSAWAHLFEGGKFFREIIYTDQRESSIALNLSALQAKYTGVKIGSYPQEPGKLFNVMVTIEGSEKTLVQKAALEIEVLVDGRR